jgi:tetratricopeptide (TPR) repeat protein
MRTPGEPVTRDDILPTSIEVKHKDRKGGFARLHDPLQELAEFLGPQRSREGVLYRDEAPENSELAIAALEDALPVLARERNHDVVLPQSSDAGDNDGRQGFARLRDSLQELTDLLEPQKNRERAPHQESVPEADSDWAAARMKLGLAYAQRDDGDRCLNWEMAIAAFEDALSVLTRERNPEEWATARMNLGVAYRDRLAGDRSDNQERAICALKDSLSVWTRERNPEQWAAARMNLGIAYWEREAGDRQENQERAIRAFEDCLSVWTSGRDPEHWATIKMNLGVGYRERHAGHRWDNQERALGAFEGVLSVWSRERNPE